VPQRQRTARSRTQRLLSPSARLLRCCGLTLPVNIQMLPTTNQMSKKGPATHMAHSRQGKQAAKVKVAASLAPDEDSIARAKTERKTSQATPFTHSQRDRLWLQTALR
jgi:hypothetical protein